MKYIVTQTFETLGDPCKSTHETREAAEAAAETLRAEIAVMVSGWETPDSHNPQPTGFTNEIAAWAQAEEITGVEYDDDGGRTSASPKTWGEKSGIYIASKSVSLDEDDSE